MVGKILLGLWEEDVLIFFNQDWNISLFFDEDKRLILSSTRRIFLMGEKGYFTLKLSVIDQPNFLPWWKSSQLLRFLMQDLTWFWKIEHEKSFPTEKKDPKISSPSRENWIHRDDQIIFSVHWLYQHIFSNHYGSSLFHIFLHFDDVITIDMNLIFFIFSFHALYQLVFWILAVWYTYSYILAGFFGHFDTFDDVITIDMNFILLILNSNWLYQLIFWAY